MKHNNDSVPFEVIEAQYVAGFHQKKRANLDLDSNALQFKILRSRLVKILKKGIRVFTRDSKGDLVLSNWGKDDLAHYYSQELPANQSSKQLVVKIGEESFFGRFFRTSASFGSQTEDNFCLDELKRDKEINVLLSQYLEFLEREKRTEAKREGKREKSEKNQKSPKQREMKETPIQEDGQRETSKECGRSAGELAPQGGEERKEELLLPIETKERKVRIVQPKFLLKFKHLNGKCYIGVLYEYIAGSFAKLINEIGEPELKIKQKALEESSLFLNGFAHFCLHQTKSQKVLTNVTMAFDQLHNDWVITKFSLNKDETSFKRTQLNSGFLPFKRFYETHICSEFCRNLPLISSKNLKDRQLIEETAMNSQLVTENREWISRLGFQLGSLHFSTANFKVFEAKTVYGKKSRVIFLSWAKSSLDISPLKEGLRIQESLAASGDPDFPDSSFIRLEHSYFNEKKREAIIITEHFMSTLSNFQRHLSQKTLQKLKGKSIVSSLFSFCQSFITVFNLKKENVHLLEPRGLKVMKKSHLSLGIGDESKGFEVKEEILGLNKVLAQRKDLAEYIIQNKELLKEENEESFPPAYDKPYVLNKDQKKKGYCLGMSLLWLLELFLKGSSDFPSPPLNKGQEPFEKYMETRKEAVLNEFNSLSGPFAIVPTFLNEITVSLCPFLPENQISLEEVIQHLQRIAGMDISIGLQGIILEEEESEGTEDFPMKDFSQSHGKLCNMAPTFVEFSCELNSSGGLFSSQNVLVEPNVLYSVSGNKLFRLDLKDPFNCRLIYPSGYYHSMISIDPNGKKFSAFWDNFIMVIDIESLEYQTVFIGPENKEPTKSIYSSSFNKVAFQKDNCLFVKCTAGKKGMTQFKNVSNFIASQNRAWIASSFDPVRETAAIINFQAKEPQLKSKGVMLPGKEVILHLLSNDGQVLIVSMKGSIYKCTQTKCSLVFSSKKKEITNVSAISDPNLTKLFFSISFKKGNGEIYYLDFLETEVEKQQPELVFKAKKQVTMVYWDHFSKNEFVFFEQLNGLFSFDIRKRIVSKKLKGEIEETAEFIGWHSSLPLKAIFSSFSCFWSVDIQSKKKELILDKRGEKKPETAILVICDQFGKGYGLMVNFKSWGKTNKAKKVYLVDKNLKKVKYTKENIEITDYVLACKFLEGNKVLMVMGENRTRTLKLDRVELFDLETKEIKVIAERPKEMRDQEFRE